MSKQAFRVIVYLAIVFNTAAVGLIRQLTVATPTYRSGVLGLALVFNTAGDSHFYLDVLRRDAKPMNLTKNACKPLGPQLGPGQL